MCSLCYGECLELAICLLVKGDDRYSLSKLAFSERRDHGEVEEHAPTKSASRWPEEKISTQ